jgi:CheY-like chemotaxis protein
VEGEKTKVGFGLGLHISQLLAKHIGGKLSVKSQLGIGSTFSLQVPLSLDKSPTTKKEGNSNSKKLLPNDTSIVLIDDNKINILLAKQIFNNYKNIQYFEDAHKALSYIENSKPNIVITDIIMPQLSGWNVLETIKTNKNLNNTKVFANTAEGTLAENKTSKFQFDGVLDKGFDTESLSKIYYN